MNQLTKDDIKALRQATNIVIAQNEKGAFIVASVSAAAVGPFNPEGSSLRRRIEVNTKDAFDDSHEIGGSRYWGPWSTFATLLKIGDRIVVAFSGKEGNLFLHIEREYRGKLRRLTFLMGARKVQS